MNFRVYYADGSTYDGDAFFTPTLGVLVIVERDPDHGRRLISNGDFYVWEGTRWRAVDYFGMVDYLIQPGPRRVLIGRMVDNEVFFPIARRAENDPDFPIRTAHGCYERKLQQ